jgi:hypothetical protein
MLLRSLFERWPYAHADTADDEESPLSGFYSFPPQTPVMLKYVRGRGCIPIKTDK